MKRHIKIGLILAAVLGAIGLALCITAVVLGVGSENAGVFWDSDSSGFMVSEKMDVEESFENVESLQITAQAAEVYLETADVEKITVTAYNVSSKFQCKLEQAVLKVEEKERSNISFGFFSSNQLSQIHIQIPKGIKFKRMDIEVGAGKIETYGFDTTELEVECGTGTGYLEGNVSGACKLTCGMGELSYAGTLSGQTEVECGMGNVSMELDNQEADFTYHLKCGIGSITVGENNLSGFDGEQTLKGGQQEMDISCGMGTVNISFKE